MHKMIKSYRQIENYTGMHRLMNHTECIDLKYKKFKFKQDRCRRPRHLQQSAR